MSKPKATVDQSIYDAAFAQPAARIYLAGQSVIAVDSDTIGIINGHADTDNDVYKVTFWDCDRVCEYDVDDLRPYFA